MNGGRSVLALALVVLVGAGVAIPRTVVGAEGAAVASGAVGPGDAYLALGDSIAAGIGASRPDEGGYAAIVAGYLDRLVPEPIQRLNLAVPGETSGSLLDGDQLAWALRFLDAARRNDLRISPITVTVGANDLLRAGSEPSERAEALEDVSANLGNLLARLRSATQDASGRPTADIVFTGYYDASETPPEVAGSDGWWLAALDRTIAREAERFAVRWVDVAATFRGRENELTRYPEDIHPTDAGHRVIAEAVWRALGYDGSDTEAKELGDAASAGRASLLPGPLAWFPRTTEKDRHRTASRRPLRGRRRAGGRRRS